MGKEKIVMFHPQHDIRIVTTAAYEYRWRYYGFRVLMKLTLLPLAG